MDLFFLKNCNYDYVLLRDSLTFNDNQTGGIMTLHDFVNYNAIMNLLEIKIRNNIDYIRCIPFISNCNNNYQDLIRNIPYGVFNVLKVMKIIISINNTKMY